MKFVNETAAAQSISAYVIISPSGEHVATVQIHFANGGTVRVDIWDHSPAKKAVQQARAGGGGYDKKTACLAGMVIDGHKMYDHCGQNETSRQMLADYHAGKVTEEDVKKQYPYMHFANWIEAKGRYANLYIESGLDLLAALGYKVIQAI